MTGRFICKSIKDTEQVAQNLAKELNGNEIIAMFGDLGAGKTTFTKALCKALSVDDDVTSPTFALVNEYRGKYKIYHFDMYRIATFDDLESIGFFEFCDENAVIITEWSENIKDFITPDITVFISYSDVENERIIDIKERSEQDENLCT